MSPEERSLRARIAANTRWALCQDRSAATQAARDAQWQRYLDTVDPDSILDEAERHSRADNLFKADQQRRSLKAAKARRLRAESKQGDDAA